MSGWVRVDTRFTTHPKVLDIGPLAEALWLRGLCYAGEHLTDGFIPAAFVRRMGDMNAMEQAERLVESGLWTASESGYQIHEYLTWQRSREEAAEISEKRAASGRKGGLQKASNAQAKGKQTPSKLPASPASKRLADTDTDTDTDTYPPLSPLGDEDNGAHAARPKAKGSRLPDDWAPSETDVAFARGEGLSDGEVQRQAVIFADYWRAQSGQRATRTDWAGVWRNWIRKHVDDRPQLRVVNGSNGHAPKRLTAEEVARAGLTDQF